MCGLVGALLYPQRRSLEDFAAILSITTSNLLCNEERGRDATGVAVVQADGAFQVFKQPVAASVLVDMPGYAAALAAVGAETVCILGHTRMPTKGSRWHNVNNHPIVAQNVIGIHNGVIRNDDELFAGCGVSRVGEVDSEIIFRLQGLVDPRVAGPRYAAETAACLDGLRGRAATLSVDVRQPTRLVALKYLRPLCLHYEPSLHALFFSSRYVFLRRAFGRSVITEAIESDFGYCFDATRVKDLRSTPVERFRFVLDPDAESERSESLNGISVSKAPLTVN
jgi:glucosamine 6-phosphate synthetase-like amidotransferase/phosphosugar isomerase protein